ncbi:MAG: hypothetical protein JEZ11_26315 [Desulfobacterales bacterium]|nr:hypothetical protein [Desulfobacterales bacterium]
MPTSKKTETLLMRPLLITVLILLTVASVAAETTPPTPFRGIYLPGQCLTDRRIDKALYYAPLTGINAVVLHAKDPRGRLYWESQHPLAATMGAPICRGSFQKAVRRLKADGIWVIAKVDVFIDTLLVRHHPRLGVTDNQTGASWADRHGLHWANPYDPRVWQYNIELAKELAGLGIDEIQFDYIRFPTDGELARIGYPGADPAQTRAATIGAFLAAAQKALKPLGVLISVDLFGLTAWKTDDFGVGQVIEMIAPHVDVICPMLYPSHFPAGFLGWPQPGEHPRQIMKKSLNRLKKRTDRPVRPWVQGFWYTPTQINDQLNGIADADQKDWSVWNPAGNYTTLYKAVSDRTGQVFAPPKFYPSLETLRTQPPSIVRGHRRIIHYSDPGKGYALLCLEAPVPGALQSYHTLQIVLSLMDEAVMDRILTCRRTQVSPMAGRRWKIARLVQLISEDLNLSPRKIRPRPIYIDWGSGNTCRFTLDVPQHRLKAYQGLNQGE